MTVLLIHLSDIHIANDDDPILDRVSSIRDALRADLAESDNILLVTTGDIAYSGETKQYDLAKRFYSELEEALLELSRADRLTYLVVPGNHDCYFEDQTNSAAREQTIQDIVDNPQLLKKSELITKCVEPMANYFKSCSPALLSGAESGDERFIYERVFEFSDTKMKFIGYNTAWMSLKDRGHGNILFPMHLIPSSANDEPVDLVFSVMHHPYAWIRADVAKTFRDHVESVSNVIITGHEHDSSYRSTTDLNRETRQYIAGGELQDIDEPGKSVFNSILLDGSNRKMRLTRYSWQDTLYSCEQFDWLDIPRSSVLRQDKFVPRDSFRQFLREPGVPFSHPRKTDLSIDDIFIYPELEDMSGSSQDNVILSADTLGFLLDSKRTMVFGSEYAGKTSLLKIMFREHKRSGVVPIWVNGEDIKTTNPRRLKRLFDSAFEQVYGDDYLEDFWQLDPTERALFIDDFQNTDLTTRALPNLFDYLHRCFGTVLISSSHIMSVQELVETQMSDFFLDCSRVALSEFGKSTRNDLIEKWLLLGQEDTIKDEELDNTLKQIDEKARVILKPSVAPSYPFYILTIAQSEDNQGSTIPQLSKDDRGSFGFFYEWLITTALHRNPKRIADVSVKYRYLASLAHQLYQEGRSSGDIAELQSFHNSYLQRISLRFIDLPYDDMVADLRSSGLLRITDARFEFKYPCIYYYFIARTLNVLLQQPEKETSVKEIISKLADRIDLDENENILLFLSYLSENPFIRNTLVETAEKMFSANDPANYQDDIAFINRHNFTLDLQLPAEKPRDTRAAIYREEDKRSRLQTTETPDTSPEKLTEEELKFREQYKAVRKAFKMVRVMGHIVKNFATVWEGPHKFLVAEEAYLLGLRAIRDILCSMEQSYNVFVEHVKDTIRFTIEKEMQKMSPDQRKYPTEAQLQIAARGDAFARLLKTSSNGLMAIAKNVGMAQLYPIHQQVLEKHNALMSVRLIDLAIKLDCQYQIPLTPIAELLKDLQGNYIAEAILKRMAFKRMFLWESDRIDKQKCCKLLGIKLNDPRLHSSRRKLSKK